jgi:hypothetical protein
MTTNSYRRWVNFTKHSCSLSGVNVVSFISLASSHLHFSDCIVTEDFKSTGYPRGVAFHLRAQISAVFPVHGRDQAFHFCHCKAALNQQLSSTRATLTVIQYTFERRSKTPRTICSSQRRHWGSATSLDRKSKGPRILWSCDGGRMLTCSRRCVVVS